MAAFETKLDTRGVEFAANRDHMLELIARLRAIEQRAVEQSARAKPRFAERGQLLPRERVALLSDPGSPFLELSTLAGWGLDTRDEEKSVPGAGVICGIGFVSGIRCMISASDSGIAAGALQPMGLDKQLRIQEIALQNRLPYVQLVESAGANLMEYRVEDFVRGGEIFRNLALLSAAGLPVITVTHGSSTAGGAYQTGLSDYIVMVRGRTRAFLAGPPLLKAATGEIATEEELGGAQMHTSISGLGDYLAEDDRHALGIARRIVANLGWEGHRRAGCAVRGAAIPGRRPARHHAGRPPPARRHARGDRAARRCLLFDEIGSDYGSATVCGFARIRGRSVGFITNNGPIRFAGREQGDAFHPALLPVRHADRLPPQHHGLHGWPHP